MAPDQERRATARRFRVHDRRTVRLGASVAHADAGWNAEARVHNVGLGGACIEVAQPLAAGDRIVLGFMAPTLWDPLHIRAKVAWVRPGGTDGAGDRQAALTRCGCAFEHADAASVLALFELIGTLAF
ncbi:MAG: hypothetical protein JWM74_4559 [Myxococcaceae bacterium]|nr:hypothetical protein [Myxococcaceae bacterium]